MAALERIGFLHLPKAAGTSLTNALRVAVSDPLPFAPVMDRTLFGSFDRFDEMSERIRRMIYLGDGSDLALHTLIAGHLSRTTLCTTLAPSQVFTVLREPRVRLLSQYFFWQSLPQTERDAYLPWDTFDRAAQMELPEFLTTASFAAVTDNLLTRMLLVPNSHILPDRFLADVGYLSRRRVQRRASMLLADLGCAVPLEIGDRLVPILSAWCGRPIELQHLNRTERSADTRPDEWLTSEVETMLAARTSIDRTLYRWACERHGLDPAATEAAAWTDYLDSMAGG